jgi:hypothetical protein
MICKTLVYTLLFLGPHLCIAQCGDHVTYTKLECVTKTCKSFVFAGFVSGGDLYYESCSAEDCCGQLITTCSLDGGDCAGAVRDPAARKRIAEFAESSRVLVADCKGHFGLYASPPAEDHFGADAVVSERVLR